MLDAGLFPNRGFSIDHTTALVDEKSKILHDVYRLLVVAYDNSTSIFESVISTLPCVKIELAPLAYKSMHGTVRLPWLNSDLKLLSFWKHIFSSVYSFILETLTVWYF